MDCSVLCVQHGFGCHIGHTFAGALAYADDIVLISPTANGMRKMLNLCDKYMYATDFDIVFNASKSKCIINRPRGCSLLAGCVGDVHFTIGGNNIQIVDDWPHLGHYN